MSAAVDYSGIVPFQDPLSFKITTANAISLLGAHNTHVFSQGAEVARFTQHGLVIPATSYLYSSYLTVKGNAYLQSNATVSNSLFVQQDAAVQGQVAVAGQLAVQGAASFGNDLAATGQVTAASLAVDGSVVSNTLAVANAVTVGALFSLDASAAAANLWLGGALHVTNSATVQEQLTVQGPVAAQAAVAVAGELTVESNVHAQSSLLVGDLVSAPGYTFPGTGANVTYQGGNVYVSDSMRVQGNLFVDGDLVYLDTQVQTTDQFSIKNAGTGPALRAEQDGDEAIFQFVDDGNVVMQGYNSNIDVFGNLWVSKHVTVGQTLTQAGNATFQSSVQVGDQLNVSGNATVLGTLHASQTLSADSDAVIQGCVTVYQDLHVTGAGNIGGSFGVAGDAFFQSDVAVANSLAVGADASVQGLLSAGDLYVANGLALGEELTANTLTLGNTLTVGTVFSLRTEGALANVQLQGAMAVSNALAVAEGASVGGELDVASNALLRASLAVSNGLTVAEPAALGAELTVQGNASLASSLNVAQHAVVGGSLELAQIANVGQFVTAPKYNFYGTSANLVYSGGNVYLNDSLRVAGDFFVDGNLTYLDTTVQVTDQFSIENAGTGPALNVHQTGDQAMFTFLDDGKVIMQGRNSNIDVYGNLFTSNHVVVGETLAVGSSLAVAGGADVDGALDVLGNATLRSNLLVSNSLHVLQDLAVDGTFELLRDAALHANVLVDGPALRVPVGNSATRPAPAANGYVRYNEELQAFEGFGPGGAWGTLGGVVDVDRDTYIRAESAPGADDDSLVFFTVGAERLRIGADGNLAATANLAVAAGVEVGATLDVQGDARLWSSLAVTDAVASNTLAVGNSLALGTVLTAAVEGAAANVAITGNALVTDTLTATDLVVVDSLRLGEELTANTVTVGNTLTLGGGAFEVETTAAGLANAGLQGALQVSNSLAVSEGAWVGGGLDVAQWANVGTFVRVPVLNFSGTGANLSYAAGNVVLSDSFRVQGSLFVDGNLTYLDTQVQTTDQFSVTNDGTGPALRVEQLGSEAMFEFVDDGTVIMRGQDSNVSIYGNLSASQQLVVGGESSLVANVSMGNSLAVAQQLTVGGDASLAQNLSVAGESTLVANAAFSNHVTVSKTLSVSDEAHFSGFVGVACVAPLFPLDVQSSNSSTYQQYAFYGNMASGQQGDPQSMAVSVRAVGAVVADQFAAVSDQRVKKNIELDHSDYLATLETINLYQFEYKDAVARGQGRKLGFIAQQLKQAAPQAVRQHRDFVPDIFENAPVAEGGWIMLDGAAAKLAVGDTVKVIGSVTGAHVAAVSHVSESGFKLDASVDDAEQQVFVYGRLVADFHVVDPDHVFTLGLGGIRQLHGLVKDLQARVAVLESAQ